MAERRADPELESSTNRWMVAGVVLTVLLFLAFPIFRFYEPANRAEAREVLIESMVAQGEELYAANCASCHGDDGEGVDAPALNSQQFLTSVTDEQVSSIIAHGIPGSEMSAYGLDFGGFLTLQQINGIAAFLRSLEEDAPDRPDWRFPGGAHDRRGTRRRPRRRRGTRERPRRRRGTRERPRRRAGGRRGTRIRGDGRIRCEMCGMSRRGPEWLG
ncbi:MAG: cytochrome c [Acidobacteria bacterium]|nr:cytochrome c [Acidobacteriota bacterium]